MNSRAEPTGMAVPACIGKRRLKDKFRRATSDYLRMLTAQLDVLKIRYSEQTPCFMVWLKWPIGGPSSILTKS